MKVFNFFCFFTVAYTFPGFLDLHMMAIIKKKPQSDDLFLGYRITYVHILTSCMKIEPFYQFSNLRTIKKPGISTQFEAFLKCILNILSHRNPNIIREVLDDRRSKT